jgi:hypothetical protein
VIWASEDSRVVLDTLLELEMPTTLKGSRLATCAGVVAVISAFGRSYVN